MADNKNNKNRGSNDSELDSIMSKFHKDFRSRSEKMLGYMKYQHDYLVEQSKRNRLSSVTNVSTTNVSNVTNVNERIGSGIAKPITKQIVESDKVQTKQLDDLTKTAKADMDQSKKQHKESKSIFRNTMVQMRVFDVLVTSVKKLLSGPSDTDRIVNAVTNVEMAVLGKERIALDERAMIQRIMEGESGVLSMFPQLESALGSINFDASNFTKTVNGAFNSFTMFAASGMKTVGDVFGGVVNSFSQAFEKGDVKQNVEKSGKKFSFDIISVIDKMMEKAVSQKLTDKKSSFFGSLALFGDMTDFTLSTSILKPIKTIKFAGKIFKHTLSALINKPLYQTTTIMYKQFGAAGIAVAGFMKLFKPFTFLFKDHTEVLGTVSESFSKFKKSFKKKIGKGMLGLGAFMAAKGIGLMGIFSTAMVIGMAALPFILGAAAVAAISGIGLYFYNNWDKVSSVFKEYISDPLVGWFSTMAETVSNKVTEIKSKIKNTFTSIFESIFSSIKSAVKSLPGGDYIASKVFGETTATTNTNDTGSSVKQLDKVRQTQMSKEQKELIEIQKRQLAATEKMNRHLENIERKEPISPLPSTNPDDIQTMVLTQ